MNKTCWQQKAIFWAHISGRLTKISNIFALVADISQLQTFSLSLSTKFLITKLFIFHSRKHIYYVFACLPPHIKETRFGQQPATIPLQLGPPIRIALRFPPP